MNSFISLAMVFELNVGWYDYEKACILNYITTSTVPVPRKFVVRPAAPPTSSFPIVNSFETLGWRQPRWT